MSEVHDTPTLLHLIQQVEQSRNPRDVANAAEARRELTALKRAYKEVTSVKEDRTTGGTESPAREADA